LHPFIHCFAFLLGFGITQIIGRFICGHWFWQRPPLDET
jgi:hypothetical protein